MVRTVVRHTYEVSSRFSFFVFLLGLTSKIKNTQNFTTEPNSMCARECFFPPCPNSQMDTKEKRTPASLGFGTIVLVDDHMAMSLKKGCFKISYVSRQYFHILYYY